MAVMGPVLERTLVENTYACRVGKGTLAAVHRAHAHHRGFPWCVQLDVRSYFDSIGTARMHQLLARRFKHPGMLRLCEDVLAAYSGPQPGRGLPIGALTSQYFANLYLDRLDRWLLEEMKVGGMVRYMDDTLAWVGSKVDAQAVLAGAQKLLAEELQLELHPRARVSSTAAPVTFLGFRVARTHLGLSRRRRARYRATLRRWERAYRFGVVDEAAMQAVAAALEGMVAHAHARGFRRRVLADRGLLEI